MSLISLSPLDLALAASLVLLLALMSWRLRLGVERRVLIAVGRSDGRPIILVPELTRGSCTGMVLLHVRMRTHDQLDAATVRSILTGYRNRYGLIRDAVTETNASFRDEDLLRASLLELLTEPVLVIADRLIDAS